MPSPSALSGHRTAYHLGQDPEILKVLSSRNALTDLAYLLPTLRSLPSNFTLLDIGCGPASITFSLAKLFPEARIIGVDQDEGLIKRNQELAERQKTLQQEQLNGDARTKFADVEFRVGDILNPESFLSADEIGSFDVVNEHTTIACIPNNIRVLVQMRRIARPDGGIIASRNGDVAGQILYPPLPSYVQFLSQLYALHSLDDQTGRKLVEKALKAGWRRDQIQASASVMTKIESHDRAAWAQSLLIALEDTDSYYSKGARTIGLDESMVEKIREDMRRFQDAEEGWRLIVCGEVICRNGD